MVSLKTIFKCYKVFFVLTSFFILGGTLQSFAAVDLTTVLCRDGYKKCCVDGVLTCVDEDDTNYKYCLTTCGNNIIIDPIETCTSGAVQYKPSGTCGTSSRTCCSSGSWSGWDAACPKTCDGTKPITSRSCGTNGTQSRSVTCNTSTGEWVEGAWGTCEEQVCTPGEVEPCPTNCYQRRTCNADGTAWSSCACENNDEIWRITMTYQNVTQSSNTCEAHCCCSGDTPVSNVYNKNLGKNLGTGCLGENGTYEYYCACQEKGSSSPSSGYTGTQSQCLR